MATIVLPAILGLVISLFTNNADWIVLIGIFLLMGVALDTLVYSWLLRYQPPWMTFVLAIGEFALLYAIASLVKLDLSLAGALALYWSSWVLIELTRIVILPIYSLTYLESAGEFRRIQWSIPPSQAIVPLLAEAEPAGSLGPLVARASQPGAPALERKPSPSGIHGASAPTAEQRP